MQLNLFTEQNKQQILNALFHAYFDARRNKRNTANALLFEKNFEPNLFGLCEEIINYTYQPKPSICFMVNKPVKREIFAADFRDRVIHHFIYNYISPIFEKTFINDSYSCRKGKGTHYGIKRIDHFIRSCSENYTKGCYILKLDIRGYFMSINKKLLFEKVRTTLLTNRLKLFFDLPLILYLLEKTIFNDPVENCRIKGVKEDWKGLPASKSLFKVPKTNGLPIGNLTSQLFGNVYLNDFDHFVKRDLGIRFYGRYVDDFVIVHPNKHYLQFIIAKMKSFLKEELQLDLHPNKIYLQHFSKGVSYLGAVIKPHRIYVSSRTKGNFYQAIQKQNKVARDHKPNTDEKENFISSMNSYLGILKHYKTYNIRKNLIKNELSGWWWNYVKTNKVFKKFILK